MTIPPRLRTCVDAIRREGLNKAQVEAVEHGDGPASCHSRAGTGQDEALSPDASPALIERGVNPSKILALTFTERRPLTRWRRGGPSRALRIFGRVDITFHSFGDRVLHDSAIAMGLTPRFQGLERRRMRDIPQGKHLRTASRLLQAFGRIREVPFRNS